MLQKLILSLDKSYRKNQHVITFPKTDNSKTPNDFGFQKLCFPLKIEKPSKKEGIEEKVEEKNESNEIAKLVQEIIKLGKETKKTNARLNEDYNPKHAINIYEQHSKAYNDFMSSYIYSEENSKTGYSFKTYDEKKEMREGDEVMNHKQRKEYAKKLMMNARYGNRTIPHASQSEKLQYELWKVANKGNLLLSFAMYDSLQMVQ